MNLAGTNDALRWVTEDVARIGLVDNPPQTPGRRSRAGIARPMGAILAPGHPLALADRQPPLTHPCAYPIALLHGSFATRSIAQMAEQMEKVGLAAKTDHPLDFAHQALCPRGPRCEPVASLCWQRLKLASSRGVAGRCRRRRTHCGRS
jgi:hypothetical protein